MIVCMLQVFGCFTSERVFALVCIEMCDVCVPPVLSVLGRVTTCCPLFCSPFPVDTPEEDTALAEESIYANLEDIEW